MYVVICRWHAIDLACLSGKQNSLRKHGVKEMDSKWFKRSPVKGIGMNWPCVLSHRSPILHFCTMSPWPPCNSPPALCFLWRTGFQTSCADSDSPHWRIPGPQDRNQCYTSCLMHHLDCFQIFQKDTSLKFFEQVYIFYIFLCIFDNLNTQRFPRHLSVDLLPCHRAGSLALQVIFNPSPLVSNAISCAALGVRRWSWRDHC